MTESELKDRKFPIGPFQLQENINDEKLAEMINTIESAPAKYQVLLQQVTGDDLKKTYREGSWNVQQLVNHVADIQMLHFLRMKCAITEDYKEVTLVNIDGWVQTSDGRESPVSDSLEMLQGVTKRLVHLMRSLDKKQHAVTWYHPIRKIHFDQKNAIALTAWHVTHHLGHIRLALGS